MVAPKSPKNKYDPEKHGLIYSGMMDFMREKKFKEVLKSYDYEDQMELDDYLLNP